MTSFQTGEFIRLNKKGLTRFPTLSDCYEITYLFSFGIEARIEKNPDRVQILQNDEFEKCDDVNVPRKDFKDLFYG